MINHHGQMSYMRGHKAMQDKDLTSLYELETKFYKGDIDKTPSLLPTCL